MPLPHQGGEAMKKSLGVLAVLILALAGLSCGKRDQERMQTIGLFQFAPDPTIDSAREGFLKGLEDQGFKNGSNVKIDYKNAQADFMNIHTIVQAFVSSKVDLIVPLTTPCLQATIGRVDKIPVVFTAIYDPYIAGAAKSPVDHPANVTGIDSFPPVEETIKLARDLFPGVKRLGTIWNTSELCAAAALKVARAACKEEGIELVEISITASNEVLQAAQALAQKEIDAFYVVGDNTVLTSFDAIVKVSGEQRIPIIMNDPEFAERGAVAAVGFNFYESGYAGGKLAARILRGESPERIPIQSVVVPRLIVNLDNARQMGVNIPDEIIQRADEVIGE